jgi:ABC-type multidrug transport system fused ATPase/permease subunit
MHNIRYGRLEATDEEVMDAAKQAKVHDAVMKLSHGYKTTVGERGLMVSGGEKQRLAIARVLLKDPPIVFFDEAVSYCDYQRGFANGLIDIGAGQPNRNGADEEHQFNTTVEEKD